MKFKLLKSDKIKFLLKKASIHSIVLLLGVSIGIYLQRNDSVKIYLNSYLEELILFSIGNAETEKKINLDFSFLKVRKLELSRNQDIFDTEYDSKYVLEEKRFYPKQSALILVDIWDTSNEPNDGFRKRHESFVLNKIVPLINLARKLNIQIIHSPHGSAISTHVKVLPEDILLEVDNLPFQMQSLYLYNQLHKRGITTLLYSGNSTHKCLFDRPDGIYAMRKLLNDFILVRDATMAFEYHSTIKGELMTTVFTNYIEESYGVSTTIDDINMSSTSPGSI